MSTIDLTAATFDATVNTAGIVLIDWWVSRCGPARAFAPVFAAAAKAHPDILFGKVDCEAERALMSAFDVRAIPTLSVLHNGIVTFHRAGIVSREMLDDLIAQARTHGAGSLKLAA